MNYNNLTKNKSKRKHPVQSMSVLLESQTIGLNGQFKYVDLTKINLLIGRRRKNGNQQRMNMPTTMPKVFAGREGKSGFLSDSARDSYQLYVLVSIERIYLNLQW